MIVPLVLLVCDRCEEVIADGFSATEARKAGLEEGYVRHRRVDLCAKCARAPKIKNAN